MTLRSSPDPKAGRCEPDYKAMYNASQAVAILARPEGRALPITM